MDALSVFLAAHQRIAYLVLGTGAFLETVFPCSLFVAGELFFLAGATLAGMGVLNIWEVSGALYLGGIVGDSTSYLLGRWYGRPLYGYFSGRPRLGRLFSEANLQKGTRFFERYGLRAVFLARLSGPFSWITPLLAGIFQVPYQRFAAANIPGVLLGIGEFIVAGYLLGKHSSRILALAPGPLLVGAAVIAFLIGLYRKRRGAAKP